MAFPLGPRPLPGQIAEPLTPSNMRAMGLSDERGPDGLIIDSDEIWGLLSPFNGRARRAIVAGLRGGSRGMCSMAAGVDVDTLRRWEKLDPEFSAAMSRASNLGFTTTFERELYSRALAGSDDRGSMRALELVVKARDPNYREKSQVQMDIVMRAQEQTRQLAGGWRNDGETEDSGSDRP